MSGKMKKIDDKLELGIFYLYFEKMGFCEHCGDLPPYSIIWSAEENSCTWCLHCAKQDEMFTATEEYVEQMKQIVKETKIADYISYVEKETNKIVTLVDPDTRSINTLIDGK